MPSHFGFYHHYEHSMATYIGIIRVVHSRVRATLKGLSRHTNKINQLATPPLLYMCSYYSEGLDIVSSPVT
jgi:hypothetical protein